MANFSRYRPREAPASLPFMPVGMTPLQQRSYLATQGVSGEGGQFGDPSVRDFYLDTLLYHLTGAEGGFAEGASLLPIENQYLAQTFGVDTQQGLEGILNDLIRMSGRSVAGPAEDVDSISRNLEERERGERTGNEPFGDVGVSMAPDIGLTEGTLAGALAAGLTGAAGLGPAGAAIGGLMGGQPGVQGPVAPQVGTGSFADTVAAGSFADAVAAMKGHGMNVGLGPGTSPGGGAAAGPPSGPGTFSKHGFTFGSPYSGSPFSKGGGFHGGGGGVNPGPGQGGPSASSPAGGAQAAGGHAPGTGFAEGGMVPESRKPGEGQKTEETLHEGEYVMTRAAIEAFGKPIFDALNKYAKRKQPA